MKRQKIFKFQNQDYKATIWKFEDGFLYWSYIYDKHFHNNTLNSWGAPSIELDGKTLMAVAERAMPNYDLWPLKAELQLEGLL